MASPGSHYYAMNLPAKRESASLVRRKRTLAVLTTTAGAFGGLVACGVGALVLMLAGGGSISWLAMVLFIVSFGAFGGWVLGRVTGQSLEP